MFRCYLLNDDNDFIWNSPYKYSNYDQAKKEGFDYLDAWEKINDERASLVVLDLETDLLRG